MSKTTMLGCAGAIGLVLLGLGVAAMRDFEGLAAAFVDEVTTQSEKAQTNLFRWGELMSLAAELEEERGVEAELAYERVEGERVLRIALAEAPAEAPAEADEATARELAAFVLGKTKKAEQVDVVEVVVPAASRNGADEAVRTQIFRFEREELMPAGPLLE